MTDRERLFDAWAASYDGDVAGAEGFPFEGYERTLAELARVVMVEGGGRVLELGVGTGALTERLLEAGCEVWGIDVSSAMLERARGRVPAARLYRADVLGEWPTEFAGLRFDRIVSTYVLHELPDARKVELVGALLERWLVPGGAIVIGDVAFGSRAELERQRKVWRERWDEDEHYWAMDEIAPSLAGLGLGVSFVPTSFCAGVMVLQGAGAEGSGS
ncbi:MAG: class I SAM-dependent methyltransferase [Deinococcales bacterium]